MEFLINSEHLRLIRPLLRSALTADEGQALAYWQEWREMKPEWEFHLDELRALPLAKPFDQNSFLLSFRARQKPGEIYNRLKAPKNDGQGT